MTITTVLMMISFKKNYDHLGFNWMWWITIVCVAIYILYFITKFVLKWGDIEIEGNKLKIKEFPCKNWIFELDQIERFGTKKIWFMEYPTIKLKPLLVEKDEIVILHRYEKGAKGLADFLNKYYQNKAGERNAEIAPLTRHPSL